MGQEGRNAQNSDLSRKTSCERETTPKTQLAKELGPGKTIVTILPDRGERYLSLGV
jgi:hypothetical protein